MGSTGFPVLVPQDFIGMNRGDLFVPAGRVGAAQLQAVLATPFQGPMHVHAVPIYFAAPKAGVAKSQNGNVSLSMLEA